jgi:hypothetical protein
MEGGRTSFIVVLVCVWLQNVCRSVISSIPSWCIQSNNFLQGTAEVNHMMPLSPT